MLKNWFKKFTNTIKDNKSSQESISVSSSVRRLHIGGNAPHPGWEILDVNEGPHVDHIMDTKDLSFFNDETFSEIYASHVLEHFDYQEELLSVLIEWYRILKPGGKLFVSVPDMDKLCHLFIADNMNTQERYQIMRMMFGGHIDKYDYHMVGLNQEFLESHLKTAGFMNFRIVDDFNIFTDTSTLQFKGSPISINIVSEKPSSIDGVNNLITEIMRTALAHHQRGELEQAEQIYRRILKTNPDHADALHLLGVLASQAGQYESSIELINQAIKHNPAVPEYHNNLGTVYYHHGHYEEAVTACEQALKLNPDFTDAYYNHGNALFQSGQYESAATAYQKVMELNPEHIDAQFNLGNTFRELGKTEEAVSAFEKAIQLNSEHAEAYNNLGLALQNLGKLEKAKTSYEQALKLNPDYAEAYNNLGLLFHSQNELENASIAFEKVLQLEPDNAEVLSNLGGILYLQHRLDEAKTICEKAIQIKPEHAEAYNNLGTILDSQGMLNEAEAHIKQAILLEPDFAEAYKNLGIIRQHQGFLEEAKSALEKAIEIKPDFIEAYNSYGYVQLLGGESEAAIKIFNKALDFNPNFAEAYNNLGFAYQDQNKYMLAINNYLRALKLKPDFYKAHSNLLFCMNYAPELNVQNNFKEHQNWAQQHAIPLADKILPHANNPAPDRTLRIGYVSPDFRFHSVAYFIEPLFREYSRDKFITIAYSDTVQPDSMTEKLQSLVDNWRNIAGMSDEQVAELVRKDTIDILVDLTGHTANNRMRVFALKPAPIQVSYLGYPNTTGLPTMDYRLTDAWADPPGQTEQFHTEELVRLPCGFLCYSPPQDCPEVGDLPALTSGHITFGCFNNSTKLNPKAISLWSKLLQQIPESQLILKARNLKCESGQKLLIKMFEENSISPNRLKFINFISSFYDHMELYNEVDIALDTSPYNGTTTTCEALWMGVPVVTLTGDTHISRVCNSILSNIDMPEFIAETPDNFVEIARDLVNDLDMLVNLRKGLRDKIRRSPLTNAHAFTCELEKIYLNMWETWCEKMNSPEIK